MNSCTTRTLSLSIALLFGFVAERSAAENDKAVVAQEPADVQRTLAAMRSATSSVVLVAAHRGGYATDKQDRAPENSVENIVRCRQRGCDLYETDIQRTRDGHFVIMHDETIDRETTGSGKVCDLTLAELKGFNKRFRDGSPSKARVATLKEFLLHGKGQTVFKADLKPGVCEHFDDLVRLTTEQSALDGIVFRVHYRELPVFVRHRENGVNWSPNLVMFRVRTRKQLDDVIETFSPTIIHIDVRKIDPATTGTLALIRYARSQGMHVQTHAEGTPDDWAKLIDAGVRMFHTAKPADVIQFLRSQGSATE